MHFNFELILSLAALLSGSAWLWQRYQRRRGHQVHRRVAQLADFSGVLWLVLVLRSWVIEPFQIPSSSMEPGLLPGDFVSVNKFAYGLRLPITGTVIIPTSEPKRGDVVVFRVPLDGHTPYIKRMVALPGDTVVYDHKRITVNGQLWGQKIIFPEAEEQDRGLIPREESHQDKKYRIYLSDKENPAFGIRGDDLFAKNCQIRESYLSCTVPEGHYLVMGDNRDNSFDGRFWGFLPHKALMGRASSVWFSVQSDGPAFSRNKEL